MELATNVVPERLSLGRYQYPAPGFAVASYAPLGIWKASWSASINGSPVSQDDYFQVVVAGEIDFIPSGTAWITGAQLVTDSRWRAVDLPGDLTADDMGQAATDILKLRSGIRSSVIVETLRPHRVVQGCNHGGLLQFLTGGYGFGTPLLGGSWWLWEASEGDPASTEYKLPLVPLAGSVAVTVDGAPFTAFAVYGSTVVRQDGFGWPNCQLLSTPAGETGTWSITYTRGGTLSRAGYLAAHELGVELALSVSNAPEAKLRSRQQQLTRQGGFTSTVNRANFDRAYLQSDLTGLELVDLWLKSVNPEGMRRRPSVMSPDSIVGS
jgi:hypothetical protein